MRLPRWFRPAARNEECQDDIEFYLETETADNIARGMAPDEARSAARRKLGNVGLLKEDVYLANRSMVIETLWQDLRFFLRGLWKTPAFTVATLLVLTLGIGGNTAMFSVIRAVLLKPLEFPDPDRLVYISVEDPQRKIKNGRFRQSELDQIHASATCFAGIGAYGANPESVSISADHGDPEALQAGRVSWNFLAILGVKPVLGRAFLPDEDKRGGPAVAMISAELWQRKFGADPQIANKPITIGGEPHTIVGVLPKGFQFPFAGLEVWVPRPSEFSMLPARFWNVPLVHVFARLKPNSTVQQAAAEMHILHQRWVENNPAFAKEKSAAIRVVSLHQQLVKDVQPALWMLLGAVGLVLIIACGNVAGLLLARAASRSRELAIRAALGAARGRLIRQLLVESIALAIAGGIAGLVLAHWSLRAMSAVQAFHQAPIADTLFVPGVQDLRIQPMVLCFTAALSVITGLLFGIIPALKVSQSGEAEALAERGSAGAFAKASRPGPFGVNARAVLVAGQIALSIVLLIGAALLVKSLAKLSGVSPGFQPANLLTMRIALPPNRYAEPEKTAFFARLVDRVQHLPGVRDAAIALSLPTTIGKLGTNVEVEGQPALEAGDQAIAQLQSVSPDYFRTLRIPLVRGREFSAGDNTPGARPVVIINEAFARRFWPAYPGGSDPVGRHMSEGADRLRSAEIIGIASDVREGGLAAEPEPEFYVPNVVHPPQTAYLVVRTDRAPLNLARTVSIQVSAIDPNQAASDIRSMDTILAATLGQRHLIMTLLAAFSGVALLLSLFGIYGVTSYSVAQRTQELGIRKALGAQRNQILKLTLRQSLAPALFGIVFGVAGAYGATRLLGGFLYNVSPTDPAAFAAVAFSFWAVTSVASAIPAWRAATIDPMTALRRN